jgi:hypothetical protein
MPVLWQLGRQGANLSGHYPPRRAQRAKRQHDNQRHRRPTAQAELLQVTDRWAQQKSQENCQCEGNQNGLGEIQSRNNQGRNDGNRQRR